MLHSDLQSCFVKCSALQLRSSIRLFTVAAFSERWKVSHPTALVFLLNFGTRFTEHHVQKYSRLVIYDLINQFFLLLGLTVCIRLEHLLTRANPRYLSVVLVQHMKLVSFSVPHQLLKEVEVCAIELALTKRRSKVTSNNQCKCRMQKDLGFMRLMDQSKIVKTCRILPSAR